MGKEKSYMVVCKEGCTRDIQIFTRSYQNYEDLSVTEVETGWQDFEGAVVVGVFKESSEETAIEKAAERYNIHASNLDVYEINKN